MQRMCAAGLLLAVWCPAVWCPAAPARADCADGIDRALRRAAPLAETRGKAALLEQIQRAQIAHHEGDEDDCEDQLSVATHVLDRIDAARRGAQAIPGGSVSKGGG